MTEHILDPRPFDQRPEHWNYGRCGWQKEFLWDERVAMSELGIGPENICLNREKRVGSVSLRGRTLYKDTFGHLSAFPFLTCLDLVSSTLDDTFVDDLLKLPTLQWLWVGRTLFSTGAGKTLERSIPGLMVMRGGEAAIQDGMGNWIKL